MICIRIFPKKIFLEALEDNFKRNVRIFFLDVLKEHDFITLNKSLKIVSKNTPYTNIEIKKIYRIDNGNIIIYYSYIYRNEMYHQRRNLLWCQSSTIMAIIKVIDNGNYKLV